MNLTRKILSSQGSDDTLVQFVRYGFVGGLAFVVDFSVLFALTDWAKIHYLISAAAAFTAGLTTNYLLSVRWVFNARSLETRWAEFLVFAVVGIVGLGLNELFLWLFTGVLGIYYLFSKMISTIVVFLWNFAARKILLFR